MKAKDLRERTTEHLQQMEKQLREEGFQARFKNFTNRLNDTAAIRRSRRDIARVKTILAERVQDPQHQDAGPAAGAESED